MLKLDAATIGDSKRSPHLQPADHQDDKHAKVFGKNPSAFIAFAKDQVPAQLARTRKRHATALEARGGANSPPLSLAVSVVKLAPLVHQDQAEAIADLGKKTEAAGRDLFTVKLEGGPALRFKVTMKALGITFITKVHELARIDALAGRATIKVRNGSLRTPIAKPKPRPSKPVRVFAQN